MINAAVSILIKRLRIRTDNVLGIDKESIVLSNTNECEGYENKDLTYKVA